MRSGSPTEIGRVADVFKLAKCLLCCSTVFVVVFVLFFICFITNIITIICESQRCHKLYAAHSPLWESEEQRYWSGCCPVWLVAVPAARPVPGVARLGGYSAACADR